jgi:hypothetical protein
MKTMKTKLVLLALALFATLNPQLSTVFAQGSLTPPGAPAPTMKTLDQVQPRTPIGDVNYTITQPGSYYLTANRTETVASSAGIWIQTNDVTLDLNGFTLRGGVYSQGGIYVTPGVSNIVISHGTVAGWLTGGITAAGVYRCQILNVDVANNLSGGISVGPDSRIIGCNVVNNSVFGIQATDNAIIKDCLVVSNSTGISAEINAAIESCQVRGNGSFGIELGANSRVQDCVAFQNQGDGINVYGNSVVLNSQAVSNQGRGVFVNRYCQVSGCVVNLNNYSGIYVFYPSCQIIGNTCAGNNQSGSTSEAGILVDDNNNRVEGNHVTGSGYAGIAVAGSYLNNVIVRNTVSDNGGNNYLINTAKNDVGPVGTAATSTSPWANISH